MAAAGVAIDERRVRGTGFGLPHIGQSCRCKPIHSLIYEKDARRPRTRWMRRYQWQGREAEPRKWRNGADDG